MAKRLQLRRGTTAQTNAFTGAVGEVTVDTDKKTVVVHDGTTVGGTVLAKVSEVPSLVPQATEAVAGNAKIATTAIAQVGTNDTDFLTAKKLRDALNASGNAPVFACRAWVSFDSTTTPLTILASGNISSVILNGTGDYTINFTNPMLTPFYAVFGLGTDAISGTGNVKILTSGISTSPPLLKTVNAVRVGTGANATAFNNKELTIGVFC